MKKSPIFDAVRETFDGLYKAGCISDERMNQLYGPGGLLVMDVNILTNEQASLICDAHSIYALLENDEEIELLEQHNPELLEAYRALYDIAVNEQEQP